MLKRRITCLVLVLALICSPIFATTYYEGEESLNSLPFEDVTEISNWALESVIRAYEQGVVKGSNNHLNPKAYITRAEFLSIIINILELEKDEEYGVTFSDLDESDWYYETVSMSCQNQLVNVIGESFLPNELITRQEMAEIVDRVIDGETIHTKVFKDIDEADISARDALNSVYQKNIMVGSNGLFEPRSLATREMAIVIAMKCFDFDNKTLEQKSYNDVKTYINKTSEYLIENVKSPQNASVGGEWVVIGMAQSQQGISSEMKDNYLKNLESSVKEKQGQLHRIKYTEYDRVILALRCIGKNPKNFFDYDMTYPLSDYNTVLKQGINGPIWALIAMDSGEYAFSYRSDVESNSNRDKFINYILDKQLSQGGWSLGGDTIEADVTAMALTALAPYRSQSDVKESIDLALEALSSIQNADASFTSEWQKVTGSESISQVIVALSSLGIDAQNDSRFIKNDKNLVDALLSYQKEGGFEHIKDHGIDQVATEQAFYALVAYDRMEEDLSSIFQVSGD